MSFNMTTQSIIERRKTVTRRLGWLNAKPGDRVLAVDRLRTKEAKVLGTIEFVDVRRERLDAITYSDVLAECVVMPDCTTHHPEVTWPCIYCFIARFCKAMECTPESIVTRIEFRYIEVPS